MQRSTFEFIAGDGQALVVHHFRPDGDAPVKAVVHVVHGLAEHAARYAPVADVLTAEGWTVIAQDHRGHGLTAASDDDLGYFAPRDGWNRVVRDCAELMAHAAARHPGVPVALVGHSMGALIAQQLMFEVGGRLRAVALSAPSGRPNLLAGVGRLLARVERRRLGERGRSALIHSLAFDRFNRPFRPNRTKVDWLSRDAAEVDKYVNDPRCGFACTTSLWVQVLDALPTLARPDNLARIPADLPIRIVAGGDDPVSDRTRALRSLLESYRQAGVRDVTHRFYPGARHEVFNEVNRQEVLNDLSAWLKGHLAP